MFKTIGHCVIAASLCCSLGVFAADITSGSRDAASSGGNQPDPVQPKGSDAKDMKKGNSTMHKSDMKAQKSMAKSNQPEGSKKDPAKAD